MRISHVTGLDVGRHALEDEDQQLPVGAMEMKAVTGMRAHRRFAARGRQGIHEASRSMTNRTKDGMATRTHLSVTRWLAIAIALAMLTALIPGDIPVAASNGEVLVYAGNGAIDQGYEDFGQATGKTIDTQNVFPDDLSPYDCVILPINTEPFSVEIKQDLLDYLNDGGRVIALAEHAGFRPASIATMNDLAAFVGADLQVVPAIIDSGFQDTENIDPSPFTVGVNVIRYAATSAVEVLVGLGHQLFRRRGIEIRSPRSNT
jgi:hypothetical protein